MLQRYTDKVKCFKYDAKKIKEVNLKRSSYYCFFIIIITSRPSRPGCFCREKLSPGPDGSESAVEN